MSDIPTSYKNDRAEEFMRKFTDEHEEIMAKARQELCDSLSKAIFGDENYFWEKLKEAKDGSD